MLNNNFSIIGVAITGLIRIPTKTATQRYKVIVEMTTRKATNTVEVTIVPGIVVNKIPSDIKNKQVMITGYLDSAQRSSNEGEVIFFNKIIATEVVVLSEERLDQPMTFKETYNDED